MSFKIGSIQDALSAPVEIKDPSTGASVGATVTLAGPEHPKRKAVEFSRQRKQRASFQKTGKLDLGDPEDDEATNIDTLIACTLGWEGITDDAGKPIAYSESAAATLYATDGQGWLRAQLLAALGERDRFIKTSAKA